MEPADGEAVEARARCHLFVHHPRAPCRTVFAYPMRVPQANEGFRVSHVFDRLFSCMRVTTYRLGVRCVAARTRLCWLAARCDKNLSETNRLARLNTFGSELAFQ